MSEERESVEETEEQTEELEDTLDEGQEELETADEGVEGDEGQEDEEEVGDDGVPLKNRIAEQVRKAIDPLKRELDDYKGRERAYQELLKNLNSNNKQERETAQADLRSFSKEDFAEHNIDEQTANFLLEVFNREMDVRIAKAENQSKQNQTVSKEHAQLRNSILKDAQEAVGDEFGKLGEYNPNQGFVFDRGSAIFKRAQEIYVRSPNLRNQVDGESVAAYRALAELTSEKYGKSKPPKSKAESMKGKGNSRAGGDKKAVKVGGKFHRKLTLPEFDKLSSAEKSEYNIWQVDQDTK